MPSFSSTSRAQLDTCHKDLQVLFDAVVKHFDCSVIGGHRGRSEQDEYFKTGRSKVKFPNSRHNQFPSMAVDVAPYPIDWNDREFFYFFAGYVLATAEGLYQTGHMKQRVRWGGDWDSDMQISDNKFDDLVHFELMSVRT